MYRLVESSPFEFTVILAIMANVVVMSCWFYGASESYENTLEDLNDYFTYFFILEMILKWIGLGIVQYFENDWNKFDCLIVFLGVLSKVSEFFDPTIFRMLRVLRVLRLVKKAETIMGLIQTVRFSLPSLRDVGILLLLIYFVFALVGMQVFGHVKMGDYINDDVNFQTFLNSFLLVLRSSTGEDWNGIMHEARVQPPFCEEGIHSSLMTLITLDNNA